MIFLKLGGSFITDKTRPATAREDVIRRIAQEIRQARDEKGPGGLPLLLGHGSGSFGHFTAQATGFGQPGNWISYAETGASAARLNRIVADILISEGVPAVTMQPSASARCQDGKLIELAVGPIRSALENDLVPLVYGDVAFDDTRGRSIISTEMIFSFLAPRLNSSRILLASLVDGVFSSDPLVDLDARLIPEITPTNIAAIESQLRGSHGYDVTGGMIAKVREMVDLVIRFPSVSVCLMSGTREGLIYRALTEEGFSQGTVIHA